jgi:transcription elongation factor Elf1
MIHNGIRKCFILKPATASGAFLVRFPINVYNTFMDEVDTGRNGKNGRNNGEYAYDSGI